jgi:hypothetical protein
MNISLTKLQINTKKSTEVIDFSQSVTFLHGPVSTGKSSVARMIDYCFGGGLERTPAIQQEFISVELYCTFGVYECQLERGAQDTMVVRVTWHKGKIAPESINAPIQPGDLPILGDDVYNLSDLLFYLAGVKPIKVRKRAYDADSPMVRLSFRDIWKFCYLDQSNLDSSFFDMEDAFKGLKSRDALRFFTGLHSERLSEIETELLKLLEEQKSKRGTVEQIRAFMAQFNFDSALEIESQLETAKRKMAEAQASLENSDKIRSKQIHPTDALRTTLRSMGERISNMQEAISDLSMMIDEHRALRAELLTTKTKADRLDDARGFLSKVHFQRCPDCGTDISQRKKKKDHCRLCGSEETITIKSSQEEKEAIRRDLNDRIDQIEETITRRSAELKRMEKQLSKTQQDKSELDSRLQQELKRYDSAFIETIRVIEREIATQTERIKSLEHLRSLPQAINDMELQAGELQGKIDRLRSTVTEERQKLSAADKRIRELSDEFKRVLLDVGLPGVSTSDTVELDPRNWRPVIIHGAQQWSFWDAGSGGKKTLFNVCFALALHSLAQKKKMPVPSVLIIDSPTKNISDDENPELVKALYSEIYRLVKETTTPKLQCLLIDSDLVSPKPALAGFRERRLAGTKEEPSLISYYKGP